MIHYCIIFFISLAISYLGTIFAKNIAPSIGAIDKPNQIKIHSKPIPRLGGLAIYVAFLISIILIYYFFRRLNIAFLKNKMIGIFLGGTIVFITGFIDDIKTMEALPKLIIQSIAALILFFSGIRMNLFPNLWVSFIFTIIYVVGSYSAMDMIDGLDGLAAGVSAICSTFFLIIFWQQGEELGMLLSLILIGSSLGFLKHNFYPAKIFMGDGGSMLFGFLLATLMIIYTCQPYDIIRFIVPILILGVPITDNFLTFLYRSRHFPGKFIGAADLNHCYNFMIRQGFNHKNTVLIMYLLSIILGVNALLFRIHIFAAIILLNIIVIILFLGIRKIGILEIKK
jgi:UDP-GlcNAc:undecaprenyl-phosphate GlcNAc-1-phosphate transferase